MVRRKKVRKKGKRSRMLDSNKRARQYLFSKGWDWIWFKSHEDMRKKTAGDFYYRKDGTFTRCLDPYNLFDAIGYNENGLMWWIQIKTTNWAAEKPIKDFMHGKTGVRVLVLKIIKPSKTIKRFRVVERVYYSD